MADKGAAVTRRHNPLRAKLHATYTAREIAELFDVNIRTVRKWIANGLAPLDRQIPHLFHGQAIGDFVRKLNKPYEPERLGNHERLLEDFLLHVMAVIALLDRRGGRSGLDDLALDGLVLAVEDLDAVAADDRPVALIKVGDPLGSGREGRRVGTEVTLVVTIIDRERHSSAKRGAAHSQ